MIENLYSKATWRPQYHFTAPSGWLNDPNGLCFFKGYYHLFYQHNPSGCELGAMCWGHARSADLNHWEHLPIALFPDKKYDSYKGCYSGSAIVVDDKLFLAYTGVSYNGTEDVQSQCLAFSEDGIHFEKYTGNPVIVHPPEGEGLVSDFRDPRIIYHGGYYYMLVGTGTDPQQQNGRILLYRSSDIFSWEYQGIMFDCNGQWTPVCECPDFFQMGDKWVLLFALMKGEDNKKELYLVGDMDFDRCVFTPEKFGELDFGFDYYAPQTFTGPDGRRIAIAWLGSWFWSDWFHGYGPTAVEGWMGCMSYPREVNLRADGTLYLSPVEELNSLCRQQVRQDSVVVPSAKQWYSIGAPNTYRLCLAADEAENPSGRLAIGVMVGIGHETVITLDLKEHTISVDRSQSDLYTRGKASHRFEHGAGCIELVILVDHCSVEVFLGNLCCMSFRVYPKAAQTGLWLVSEHDTFFLKTFSIDAIQL